jgi:peptide/nickel transport system ATP-binding protein
MPVCREQSPPWRSRTACGALSLAGRSVDCGRGASRGFELDIEPARISAVDGLKVHFPIRKGFLQRTVGHVRAVDGVSLAISPGRTLALVGESGCGKTTVGKALLQLIAPSAGSVRLGDTELVGLKGAPAGSTSPHADDLSGSVRFSESAPAGRRNHCRRDGGRWAWLAIRHPAVPLLLHCWLRWACR